MPAVVTVTAEIAPDDKVTEHTPPLPSPLIGTAVIVPDVPPPETV